MKVVELLIKLLSYESITPDDGGSLEFIRSYLGEYEAIWRSEGGVKNLFVYKKFGEGPHLCFAGHVDVVPAGHGWESNPFVPKLHDGVITARGAQDMKSGVAASVQALKDTREFEGTLSLLLTSDEEGEATWGTQYILEHLKNLALLPDAAIVAEPTCETIFGDSIKVGRRGSINGTLHLKGKQGHAAYPQKATNPIHQIASILPQIAGVALDSGDGYFAPSQLVITDIRSGMEVTNVTPGELKMMFNVRNSTATTLETVRSFVEEKLEGLEYELHLHQSSKPFLTDTATPIVKALDDAIVSLTNHTPKHSTAGGTSDARFLAAYGVECVEFGVINDTIHAPNESTTIVEVEKLYEIFSYTIKHYKDHHA